MHATKIEERCCLLFWDALILAAACRAKAEILLTEDLSHDQEIKGIRILNPIR